MTTNESDSEIIVYPNPFENKLIIETSAQFKYCQLISMKGEVVISTSETKIDTENLTNGLYLIIIQTKNAKYDFKIIKK